MGSEHLLEALFKHTNKDAKARHWMAMQVSTPHEHHEYDRTTIPVMWWMHARMAIRCTIKRVSSPVSSKPPIWALIHPPFLSPSLSLSLPLSNVARASYDSLHATRQHIYLPQKFSVHKLIVRLVTLI